MTPRLIGVAAVAIALGAGLAACGDDGEEAEGDFETRAAALCRDSAAEQYALAARYAEDRRYEAITAYMDGLAASGEEALAGLEELEPPSEDAETWDDYVANRRAAVAAVRARAAAAGDRDDERITATAEELAELVAARDELGADLGLDECARVLPEADEEAVFTAVEAAATSPDGELVCERYVADELLIREFDRDLERCAAGQRRQQLAETVELTEVKGVSEAGASVEAELAGGPSDGSAVAVELVFEDGSYRIFSVTPTGER